VSALDPLRVTFAVSETDWLYLMRRVQREVKESERQLIELVLADGSIHTHKGRFIIAERQVDPKTGTLAMVCEFRNPEYHLRPGMFGRVRLAVDRKENAILIPQRAAERPDGLRGGGRQQGGAPHRGSGRTFREPVHRRGRPAGGRTGDRRGPAQG